MHCSKPQKIESQLVCTLCLLGLFCLLSFAEICLGHTQGWSRLFEDVISEFHDEELSWELGGGDVPSWLQGRYIKNGPARLNFPNQTRFYTNWMDSWGKLHSFTFNGPQVTFWGKILEPLSTPHCYSVPFTLIFPSVLSSVSSRYLHRR